MSLNPLPRFLRFLRPQGFKEMARLYDEQARILEEGAGRIQHGELERLQYLELEFDWSRHQPTAVAQALEAPFRAQRQDAAARALRIASVYRGYAAEILDTAIYHQTDPTAFAPTKKLTVVKACSFQAQALARDAQAILNGEATSLKGTESRYDSTQDKASETPVTFTVQPGETLRFARIARDMAQRKRALSAKLLQDVLAAFRRRPHTATDYNHAVESRIETAHEWVEEAEILEEGAQQLLKGEIEVLHYRVVSYDAFHGTTVIKHDRIEARTKSRRAEVADQARRLAAHHKKAALVFK